MSRQIKIQDDCRQALLRGMDAVADLVGATLGPRGQTVVLGRIVGPALVTKDGVTVARNISLSDPWENEGVKLIQEVAQKTNSEAGDGTTAATILTRALYKEGIRQITAGAGPQAIERGMRQAVRHVVQELRRFAIPVPQSDLATLTAVATIAANGDREMGSVVAQAVHHAGIEGNYSLDPSPTQETTFEPQPGLQFARGLDKWPQFANDPRGMAVFVPCNIFITDRHLISDKDMGAILQAYIAGGGGRTPLLIIAEDVAQGALQVLSVNNSGRPGQPPTVTSCPVRAPGSGLEKKESLVDIAILTGATAYTVAQGQRFDQVRFDDFGSADRVLVTPARTTIIGGHGASVRVEARLHELRERIKDPEIAEFLRAGYERRLAALSAKIAIIKIGAGVNSKLLEKRDRAEDSLNATLGALKEGTVAGGGVALVRCQPALQASINSNSGDERLGMEIVLRSLSTPLRRIASNAGASADIVEGKTLEAHLRGDSFNVGYNAESGQFEDMVAALVIDPVKVIRLALENAVELAGLLLTSAGGVVEVPDPIQALAAQQPALARSGGQL